MEKQIYFEEIEAGAEITELIKEPSTRQLVMWAGASGDLNPIHYDKDYATKRGLPGVVVHGQLASCFMAQMVTDWIGEKGSLKKLNINYKSMSSPGEKLICKGKVTGKSVEDGESIVTASLWVKNPKGEKTLTGTAKVVLPMRS